MKILFVVQNIDFFAPLGLMQISAMAKQRGDETHLLVLSKENILNKIQEYKPDIIIYSSTTGEHKYYSRINKKIKSKYKNIFTIMGGPHATFFPEILNEAELDAICIGEGEYAILELLSKIEKNEDITKIRNLWVKKEGKIFKNPLRPLIQNLDSLPFPDRKLFYRNNKNRKKSTIQIPLMGFMTSRGCPFNCAYCFNHVYKKMYSGQNYIRRHSVDYVINEIRDAKEKFDFKFIRFLDDIFVIKENAWLKEFCEKYPKEIGLPFYIHERFDLMTTKIADLLKKAGCKTLQMSIECANPRIRNEILKRKMSNKEIIRGANYCLERGLSVLSATMLGLPTSTLEDDINAVDFSIKAKIPVSEFFIFQPYPRTELGKLSIEKGLFDGDISKINMYGLTHSSVLNCFSDKEKNAQINIALLGPIVTKYPFLRNLVMNYLIYLPTNRLFRKIHTIERLITYPLKVYKRKYSLKEYFKIVKKTFRLENVKRT